MSSFVIQGGKSIGDHKRDKNIRLIRKGALKELKIRALLYYFK
jgi:hypothetical protein